MALDYIAARKVSVNETAYLVGFSDPASFSRIQTLDRQARAVSRHRA